MSTTKATLDLATLDSAACAEDGAELILLHPKTKEPTDIVITLAGMDSITYRRAEARLTEKYRRHKGKTPGQDVFRKDAAETLACCTRTWRNVQLDGQELPCTQENAAMLYQRFPWIYEQANAFVSERENFLAD